MERRRRGQSRADEQPAQQTGGPRTAIFAASEKEPLGGVLQTRLFPRQQAWSGEPEGADGTTEVYADQVYVPSVEADALPAEEPPANLYYDEESGEYYEIDEELEREIQNERTKTIYFFINLLASVVGLVLIFLLIAILINLYHWLHADLRNILRYLAF